MVDELAPRNHLHHIKMKRMALLRKGDFQFDEFWIELKDFIQSLNESIKIYLPRMPAWKPFKAQVSGFSMLL